MGGVCVRTGSKGPWGIPRSIGRFESAEATPAGVDEAGPAAFDTALSAADPPVSDTVMDAWPRVSGAVMECVYREILEPAKASTRIAATKIATRAFDMEVPPGDWDHSRIGTH